jgi:acyl transferase domain-containing protein
MIEKNYDIAIIGMSGEFPGANNLQRFWENISQGAIGLKQLPPKPQKNYVPFAGTIENIEFFAAEFFGYSPKEASYIDPQQRKLLEHAWHAFEDAGVDPLRYTGLAGVFVGSSLNTYLINNILSHPEIKQSADIQQVLFGNGVDYLATRIAYLLNLRGQALTIQTACSTSLVAIHEACQHLLNFEVDLAVAGGVSIAVPQSGYIYAPGGMLSADGQCKAFAEGATGTVFSNGVGVVILKRLHDAILDNDAIYAVIKGSAVNNDGHQKMGYTAPSVEGQAEVIALALAAAEISPHQISYLETHGTGTELGDPIEMAALQAIYQEAASIAPCVLGTLKANIGHLDAAAGVASVIKVALALQHEQLPPNCYAEQPNTSIPWDKATFYLNPVLKDWQSNADKVRYAGVSSFGIGGTNAHAIMANAPANTQIEITNSALLVFSAKTAAALEMQLLNFIEFAKSNPTLDIHSLAKTLQQGRAEWSHRAILIISDLTELAEASLNTFEKSICNQQKTLLAADPICYHNPSSLLALGRQWLAGHKINWDLHYFEMDIKKAHLPVYPFERKRYWMDAYEALVENPQKQDIADWFYLPTWQQAILKADAASSLQGTILLIANEETDFCFTLGEHFKSTNQLIRVIPGHSFFTLNDTTYRIDLNDKYNYEALFQELKNRNLLPAHIIHATTVTTHFKVSNTQTFNKQQTQGLLSLIYLLQAWELQTQQPLKLTVLTNRLNTIGADAEIEPHKAPILAAVKVIPKEYVNVQTQLIDIDAVDKNKFTKTQIDKIQHEMAKPFFDQEEIVLRGQQRWLRHYVPTPIAAPVDLTRQVNFKVVMITGGLGQLGLDIADYFTNLKGVKIALLARTEVPPKPEWHALIKQLAVEHPLKLMLQRILAMQAKGAEVQVYSCDVANEERLRAVIANIEATQGKIDGVIHAAGETVNGIISLKTKASLQESYHAKVWGSYNLVEVFKDQPLQFLVMCSSMNAIIGGLGQLDNTAANAFIDYLSEYSAARFNQPTLAINWGAINVNRPMPVNVLHQFTDLSHEHKKNRMTDNEVNAVYDRILTQKLGARVVISTIDMNVVLESWNRVASIHELAKERQAYNSGLSKTLTLENTPQTVNEKLLASLWQELLGVETIGLDDDFFALGGHSLAAVQISTKIQEQLGLKFHVMNLYEMPTLKQFSQYINQQLSSKTKIGGMQYDTTSMAVN